ncbi:unnamed protein product [Caenorhabditis auriculariae]|uniref:Uncharacterized protein n=1 Tax=Caenorhabditis auriculariae TaxID=2777116 RepID=A0A8S1H6F7_9PELO|nr:unnamed protein product [Caenorhabditis auriculariae]
MRLLWLLFSLVIGSLVNLSECSFAAMSIDLGTQFIKVGIVKPGSPMDISLNPESRRKTPNMVLIHDGHRSFGDAALAMQVRYPQEAFAYLLDLVGKSVDHPSFELFLKRFPQYAVSKSSRNETGISFKSGEEFFSVETLLAMTLANAKKFTEEHAQIPMIKDAVITVPAYFTPSERLVVEKAAEMANINVLQLINDGTAAALSHGIFRRKEITEKPQRLMVYDMGAAKTTVTIVEFKLFKEKYEKTPKLTVLGVGFDRTLGGLEITIRLRDHLVELFNKNYKTKTDVRQNKRSMAKFFKEAERLKQVLSANVEHFAQIESAHDDIDVRLKVTREDLNALISDLEPRVSEPIEQALRIAQMPIEEIDQIVLMGAGTRVPKIQEIVQRTIAGKELGKFLNTDEAIAMGALFQAAHLSKGFKVKPFNVDELVLFPVEIDFVSKVAQPDGSSVEKPVTKSLFPAKSFYPTKRKTISFTSYTEDFTFTLSYGNNELLTKKQLGEIGQLLNKFTTIDVSGLSDELAKYTDLKDEFKGVKVVFELDSSGIVRVVRADATVEASQGIVKSITNTISNLFSSKTEDGEATTETDSASAERAEKEESKPKEEKTTEQKKNETSDDQASSNITEPAGNATLAANVTTPLPSNISLKLSLNFPASYVPNNYDVLDGKRRLAKFAESEKFAAERAAAENELESFTFESSLLFDDSQFVESSKSEEREAIEQQVAKIRTWMEDEVSVETETEDFLERLNSLKKLVKPIRERIEESKTFPEALNNLNTLINTTMTLVSMGEGVDDSKALFEKKDRDAFRKKLDKLSEWLTEINEKMSSRYPNDDFPSTTKYAKSKLTALNKEVDKFMKKMKKIDLNSLGKDFKMEKDEKKPEKTEETTKEDEGETSQKKGEDAEKVASEDKGTQTDEKVEL